MTIYSAALLALIASASAYTSPAPVELGSADDYAILTKTGVTTTGVTRVTGDMASSPIAETAMTGFTLVRSIDNEFSTSGLVTGKVTSASHHEPTPTVLIAAISDMETAYTAAAGAVPDSHEFMDGGLTGQTLAPGVYKWTNTVNFSGQLVFDGTASDSWILQIAQTLDVASGAEVILAGGAKAENIFWAVAGAATFFPASTVNGIFLAKTNMAFQAGSTLNGAALVQTAVTMISTTINKASCEVPSKDASKLPSQLPSMVFSPSKLPSMNTSPTPAVDLGSACDYGILTKAGVTTTGVTHVTGDMASSPIAETGMTGFALVRSIDNEFSTSVLVTGKVTSASHHAPTPSILTTAILDMETAYTAAAGAVPDFNELNNGLLTGLTLAPGVYKWTSTVSFSGQLVFDGTASDIWILQIAKDLEVASGAEVILAGGAKAENIFWQVAEAATFGSGSTVNGIFLVKTSMSFNAGSTLNGAALVQTAVTMISTTINKA